MIMELSPAAKEVLQRYKSHLDTQLSDVWDLPEEETREVYAAERQHDAKEHADWAAIRLVAVLRDADKNVKYELQSVIGRELALRTLARGYLVQAGWRQYAYEKALELAVKPVRDHAPSSL